MNYISKFTALLSLFFAFALNSCLESEDLLTENAKTGGLIDATSALQYKPTSTESVEVEILIYKGPTVKSINIYKKYTHYIQSSDNVSISESDEVLLKTITVQDDSSLDTLLINDSFTWDNLYQGIPELPDGYSIPSNPVNAQVGDYYTLRYVSVLCDGREVVNIPQTYIVVANFFAGYYMSHLTYFHPTLGGTYPTEPYYDDYLLKELFTLSNDYCTTYFALWTDAAMDIQINADNSISFGISNFNYIVNEGDPYDLTKVSHYDPATHTIYLYYNYAASGGYRVFWETLTPYSK